MSNFVHSCYPIELLLTDGVRYFIYNNNARRLWNSNGTEYNRKYCNYCVLYSFGKHSLKNCFAVSLLSLVCGLLVS